MQNERVTYHNLLYMLIIFFILQSLTSRSLFISPFHVAPSPNVLYNAVYRSHLFRRHARHIHIPGHPNRIPRHPQLEINLHHTPFDLRLGFVLPCVGRDERDLRPVARRFLALAAERLVRISRRFGVRLRRRLFAGRGATLDRAEHPFRPAKSRFAARQAGADHAEAQLRVSPYTRGHVRPCQPASVSNRSVQTSIKSSSQRASAPGVRTRYGSFIALMIQTLSYDIRQPASLRSRESTAALTNHRAEASPPPHPWSRGWYEGS